MEFSKVLTDYAESLDVSRKEISRASGLSPATISRYCAGSRKPAAGSSQVRALARGISSLAAKRGIGGASYDEVYEKLSAALHGGVVIDNDVFAANLRTLLSRLDIRASELARGIYSDPSYISKILSGSRRPANAGELISDISAYVIHRFESRNDLRAVAMLIGQEPGRALTSSALQARLAEWLGSAPAAEPDGSFPGFLAAMDEFDLNDYLKAIHFDELRMPPSLPRLSTRKEYTGIRKMMEGELDFLKATVMSSSMEPCTLYSDMPMEEMAADPDFPKKYLFGMAMMLKKGLRLNVIHDINRPFSEMMLGLESFIPMYMTGQISPYYLPSAQNDVFCHFLKVSGAAALEGMAVAGNQAGGRYVLYRSKEDVAHYRRRAEDLLGKALPLMDIFTSERSEDYEAVMKKVFSKDDVKIICSSLPPYLLDPALLETVVGRSGLADPDAKSVRGHYKSRREAALSHIKSKSLCLVVPELSREEFEASPVGLSLADIFAGDKCSLSYDEYVSCLDHLDRLSAEFPNLVIERNPAPAFRNINISIAGERMVIVSKEKSPSIHFVIYHKRMIKAFRNFIPPIVES